MPHRIRTMLTLAVAAASLATAALVAAPDRATAEGSLVVPNEHALALGSNGRTLYIFHMFNAEDGDYLPSSSFQTFNYDEDRKLLGIDYRMGPNKLASGFYGLGNEGGVYRINTLTGRLTKVSQVTVELEGVRFAIDFDPASGQLRIVSNTGQNLRHTIGGVTTVDGDLNYSGNQAHGIAGIAYTNNDRSVFTGSRLIAIDTAADQIAAQLPGNDGTLTTMTALERPVHTIVGFDILTQPPTLVGPGRNRAFMLEQSPNDLYRTTLYKVDLTDGEIDDIAGVATYPVPDVWLIDLAVKQPL
jgi:hypothetical protein